MNLVPPKITRPRAVQVLPRMRLFRLLDQARQRPVVWVAAPPGSGKTTLVSNYLDQHKQKNIWYQADEGDSDVATLFHYLGLALKQVAPRSRKPLPQLTPEYGPNPGAFFRVYFEAFFPELETPPMLVFDNYQEVASGAIFHAAIVEAIGQIPEGGKLIVLSRYDPPPAFARLLMEGRVQRIGWDELKVTEREAHQLVKLKKKRGVAPALRQQLYELSQGWIAGLLLLLEASANQDIAKLPRGELAPQLLFNYFGSQVLDRLDATAREILVHSAFLPTMTARAVQQLTGIAQAGRVIEDLCRRNYFVVRHGNEDSVYEFHPLFRDFLLSRASAIFDSSRLRSIKQDAARLLVDLGQFEHAVSLFQDIRDEASIVGVFVQQAPSLFRQRRTETIAAWVGALSEDTVQRTPWVLYWIGMCAMASDPGKSGACLGRALELFDGEPNPAGAYLSWAAIVSSLVYRVDDVNRLDYWIAVFDQLQTRHGDFPSPDIEIQVVGSMFGALVFRQLRHPRFGYWEHRLGSMLSNVADPMLAATLGSHLLIYQVWSGQFSRARPLVEALRSKMQAPSTPVAVQLYWRIMEPSYYWSTGDFDVASRLIAESQETAKQMGLEAVIGHLLAQNQVHVHLGRGEYPAAAAILEKSGGAIPPFRRFELGHHHFQASLTALFQGDLELARENARIALEHARATGASFPQFVGHFGAARVSLAEGDEKQARWHLEQGRSVMSNATVDYSCFLFEAKFASMRGDETRALRFLRDALALARAHGIVHYPFWSIEDMADFYVKALNAGIETAYVRSVIRKRRLVPGENVHCAHWPWPVRIYTLGGFHIEREGEAVHFSRKIPRRPLDLLKIIIALGGRDVDAQRVTDELWPDAEGDAAEDSLATTLRRLRLLLGDPTTVILQDNKLALDPRSVWVDAWALERLFSRKSETRDDVSPILALYRGAFLGKETDASWALPRREALRNRFLRVLTLQSDALMQAKRYDEAVWLSERGLDVDNVAEELYRNLMRCHQARGRHTEALGAYERCRKTLSTVLGVAPSPEIEALRKELLEVEP